MAEDLRSGEASRRLQLIPGGAKSAAATERGVPSARSGGGRNLRGLAVGEVWECSIVPLGSGIASQPDGRPVVVFLASQDVAVHADLRVHPPSEYADIAEQVAGVVRDGIAAARVTPRTLTVRNPEIASPLAELLAADGVTVQASNSPANSDRMAASFLRDQFGEAEIEGGVSVSAMMQSTRMCKVDLWRGWRLPDSTIARLFHAAASFYREGPWDVLSNAHELQIAVQGGGSWTVVVMGAAGEEFGVMLFRERSDFVQIMESNHPEQTFRSFQGGFLSLSFEERSGLPRGMVQEILRARWEVAASDAFPNMFTCNAIAGGVTRREAEDLIAILDVIPRFVAANLLQLTTEVSPAILPWTDPATSTEVRCSVWMDEWLGGFPAPPRVLSPACPSGPGATPLTLLSSQEGFEERRVRIDDCAVAFMRYLMSGESGRPLSEATAAKHASHAASFLAFLYYVQGIPHTSVSEMDLRIFLYSWYPNFARGNSSFGVSTLLSLRKFFDYLSVRHGVECPWAESPLRNRKLFVQRWDARPQEAELDYEDAWESDLTYDLLDRVLLVNINEVDGFDWTEAKGPVRDEMLMLLSRWVLVWRDDAIAVGLRDPRAVRSYVLARAPEFGETVPPGYAESAAVLLVREEKAIGSIGRRGRKNRK